MTRGPQAGGRQCQGSKGGRCLVVVRGEQKASVAQPPHHRDRGQAGGVTGCHVECTGPLDRILETSEEAMQQSRQKTTARGKR